MRHPSAFIAMLLLTGIVFAAPVKPAGGGVSVYRFYGNLGASGQNTSCSSQNLTWTQGANTCSGMVPSTPNNGSRSAASGNGNVGTVTATCNGAANTYVLRDQVCTPAAVTCTSQTINWAQNGQSCAALSGTTADAQSKIISNTASGVSGTVSVTCAGATNSYTLNNPVCYLSDCTSQTVSWSQGGSNCAANTGPTNNGSSKSLSSTNGNVGSATALCNSQTNTYTVNGGATCAAPTCSNQVINWTQGSNACAANSGQNPANSTTTVSNTASGMSGQASITCNAGSDSYTVAAGATCSSSQCTSQTVSWSQGGATCSANTGPTNDGSPKHLTSTNGNTGSATATCDSRTNVYTVSGGTCAPPPPTTCSSQTVNWSQGGSNCAALSGTTNDGASKTISSTNANLGSVTIACTAAGDSYAQSGASCYRPDCGDQTVSWSQGGTTCAANTGTTNNGAAKSLSSTNGNTGSATATCNSQTNSYSVSGGSCATSTCSSQTVSWSQGGSNCAALSGTTNNGASKTISSTNANLGSVTIACTAAGDSYAQSGASCYPADCTSQTVSWSQGGQTCAANTGTTNNGAAKSLSSTNGNAGSATATCNSATNSYSVNGGSCKTHYYSAVTTGTSVCGIAAATDTAPGTLKCWGDNSTGQVGDGTTTNRYSPTIIDPGTTYGMVSVTGTQSHNCAITSTGVLKCWGSNSNGQIGDGTSIDRLTPTVVDPGTTYLEVRTSHTHTCGITSNNIAKCWGAAIGAGGADMLSPTVVDGGTRYNAMQVAIYTKHPNGGSGTLSDFSDSTVYSYACGITTAGAMKCWGNNYFGNLGLGHNADVLTPTVVDAAVVYTKLQLSYGTTYGLTQNGTLKAWGRNVEGQLGDGTGRDKNTPLVFDAGNKFSLIYGLSGTGDVCALTTDNVVRCAGLNAHYEFNVGDKLRHNVVTSADIGSVVGSVNATRCDITSDNLLMCIGSNNYGQMGDGTNTGDNATTQDHSTFIQVKQ